MSSDQSFISGGLGRIAVLALTFLISVILVVAILFAPRAFAGDQAWTFSHLLTYGETVRVYLVQVLSGLVGMNPKPPISRDILTATRRSLELVIISWSIALPLGLAWGTALTYTKRGPLVPFLFGLHVLLLSLPSFVLLLLLIQALVMISTRIDMQLVLVNGYGLDRHLIIPTTVLVLRGAAFLARNIQVTQEDILSQDWVTVARAKGFGGWRLWLNHILPALRRPLVGSSLGLLRVLVSASIIVDFLFNWGGLGRKLLKASADGLVRSTNDYTAATAAVLLICFFVGIDALGNWILRTDASHVSASMRE